VSDRTMSQARNNIDMKPPRRDILQVKADTA
jgi:hypothetical protein